MSGLGSRKRPLFGNNDTLPDDILGIASSPPPLAKRIKLAEESGDTQAYLTRNFVLEWLGIGLTDVTNEIQRPQRLTGEPFALEEWVSSVMTTTTTTSAVAFASWLKGFADFEHWVANDFYGGDFTRLLSPRDRLDDLAAYLRTIALPKLHEYFNTHGKVRMAAWARQRLLLLEEYEANYAVDTVKKKLSFDDSESMDIDDDNNSTTNTTKQLLEQELQQLRLFCRLRHDPNTFIGLYNASVSGKDGGDDSKTLDIALKLDGRETLVNAACAPLTGTNGTVVGPLYLRWILAELCCNIWDCLHYALCHTLDQYLTHDLLPKASEQQLYTWAFEYLDLSTLPSRSPLSGYENNHPLKLEQNNGDNDNNNNNQSLPGGDRFCATWYHDGDEEEADVELNVFWFGNKPSMTAQALLESIVPTSSFSSNSTKGVVERLYQLRLSIQIHVRQRIATLLTEQHMKDRSEVDIGPVINATSISPLLPRYHDEEEEEEDDEDNDNILMDTTEARVDAFKLQTGATPPVNGLPWSPGTIVTLVRDVAQRGLGKNYLSDNTNGFFNRLLQLNKADAQVQDLEQIRLLAAWNLSITSILVTLDLIKQELDQGRTYDWIAVKKWQSDDLKDVRNKPTVDIIKRQYNIVISSIKGRISQIMDDAKTDISADSVFRFLEMYENSSIRNVVTSQLSGGSSTSIGGYADAAKYFKDTFERFSENVNIQVEGEAAVAAVPAQQQQQQQPPPPPPRPLVLGGGGDKAPNSVKHSLKKTHRDGTVETFTEYLPAGTPIPSQESLVSRGFSSLGNWLSSRLTTATQPTRHRLEYEADLKFAITTQVVAAYDAARRYATNIAMCLEMTMHLLQIHTEYDKLEEALTTRFNITPPENTMASVDSVWGQNPARFFKSAYETLKSTKGALYDTTINELKDERSLPKRIWTDLKLTSAQKVANETTSIIQSTDGSKLLSSLMMPVLVSLLDPNFTYYQSNDAGIDLKRDVFKGAIERKASTDWTTLPGSPDTDLGVVFQNQSSFDLIRELINNMVGKCYVGSMIINYALPKLTHGSIGAICPIATSTSINRATECNARLYNVMLISRAIAFLTTRIQRNYGYDPDLAFLTFIGHIASSVTLRSQTLIQVLDSLYKTGVSSQTAGFLATNASELAKFLGIGATLVETHLINALVPRVGRTLSDILNAVHIYMSGYIRPTVTRMYAMTDQGKLLRNFRTLTWKHEPFLREIWSVRLKHALDIIGQSDADIWGTVAKVAENGLIISGMVYGAYEWYAVCGFEMVRVKQRQANGTMKEVVIRVPITPLQPLTNRAASAASWNLVRLVEPTWPYLLSLAKVTRDCFKDMTTVGFDTVMYSVAVIVGGTLGLFALTRLFGGKMDKVNNVGSTVIITPIVIIAGLYYWINSYVMSWIALLPSPSEKIKTFWETVSPHVDTIKNWSYEKYRYFVPGGNDSGSAAATALAHASEEVPASITEVFTGRIYYINRFVQSISVICAFIMTRKAVLDCFSEQTQRIIASFALNTTSVTSNAVNLLLPTLSIVVTGATGNPTYGYATYAIGTLFVLCLGFKTFTRGERTITL